MQTAATLLATVRVCKMIFSEYDGISTVTEAFPATFLTVHVIESDDAQARISVASNINQPSHEPPSFRKPSPWNSSAYNGLFRHPHL